MVLKKKLFDNQPPIGQIFTPNIIAEFMVKNCKKYLSNSRDIKILEPCIGEGVFLKYLIENGFYNITAYELDHALKAYLLNKYPLKKYPQIKINFKNFFSSETDEEFDLIIGNPPYLGQNYNAELFQEYRKKYPVCEKYFVGNMDLFYFFIHLGILKLKPGGILSYITTNYWITKSEKTGIKYLKPHILEQCFILQYVELSEMNLFKEASGQHNCIFVLQKKTAKEKMQHTDKKIEIIQIRKNKNYETSDLNFIKSVFTDLLKSNNSKFAKRYYSALSNNDLIKERSWNLQYPAEVKRIVDKIEAQCSINSKIRYLKDYFIIRNGLILIKDDIFILDDKNCRKTDDGEFFIKLNDKDVKLTTKEAKRLKKIYKSKSILPYGYKSEENIGYVIYFNKNEFKTSDSEARNQKLEKNYPALAKYLKQYEKELRNILINAKENPEDFYFPRRSAFIRRVLNDSGGNLVDLEPFYEQGKKIFIKYISQENIFGYAENPYFATSDTYFLWQKEPKKNLDYLFLLAYLNSKIVRFLFKAKNIILKRSKTKLEFNLPIPSLENFESKESSSIILLIRTLSWCLVNMNSLESDKSLLNQMINKVKNERYIKINKTIQFSHLSYLLKNEKISEIQTIINHLFFQLFDLKEEILDNLLENYYNN
jgi:adenine-specific DNA-methyltransferase